MIINNNALENDLIERYINNYNLKKGDVNIEKIFKHWDLEKELAKKLMASNHQNRRKIFEDSYNTLYKELPWLLKTGSNINYEISETVYNKRWLSILGPIKNKTIYEIGSGNGELINFLANMGAFCIGTEISSDRPNKHPVKRVEWHNTDGVNLTEYENASSFDYVISDQVIEHLHPDDIYIHLKNVYKILKKNGKYAFYTPHYYVGPGDVSIIFKTLEAEGMHLKEYKYFELYRLLKKTGFKKIKALRITDDKNTEFVPKFTFLALRLIERLLTFLPKIKFSKKVYSLLRKLLKIHPEIALIAKK